MTAPRGGCAVLRPVMPAVRAPTLLLPWTCEVARASSNLSSANRLLANLRAGCESQANITYIKNRP